MYYIYICFFHQTDTKNEAERYNERKRNIFPVNYCQKESTDVTNIFLPVAAEFEFVDLSDEVENPNNMELETDHLTLDEATAVNEVGFYSK